MRTSKGICKLEWDKIKKEHLKITVTEKKTLKDTEASLVEIPKDKHIDRNLLNMTNILFFLRERNRI